MKTTNSKWLILAALFLTFTWGCANHPQVSIEKKPTIAVWDLENLTPMETGTPDLGEVLSSRIIETLSQREDCIAVERQKLVLALEEMNLGSSSLADESTRLKIGRMLGAKQMVFGGYQVIGNLMRMDLRLIDVETGRLIKAGQRTITAGDIPEWLQAAEDITNELLKQ